MLTYLTLFALNLLFSCHNNYNGMQDGHYPIIAKKRNKLKCSSWMRRSNDSHVIKIYNISAPQFIQQNPKKFQKLQTDIYAHKWVSWQFDKITADKAPWSSFNLKF